MNKNFLKENFTMNFPAAVSDSSTLLTHVLKSLHYDDDSIYISKLCGTCYARLVNSSADMRNIRKQIETYEYLHKSSYKAILKKRTATV